MPLFTTLHAVSSALRLRFFQSTSRKACLITLPLALRGNTSTCISSFGYLYKSGAPDHSDLLQMVPVRLIRCQIEVQLCDSTRLRLSRRAGNSGF